MDVRKPAHNFKILFKIDFYIVNAFYVSNHPQTLSFQASAASFHLAPPPAKIAFARNIDSENPLKLTF